MVKDREWKITLLNILLDSEIHKKSTDCCFRVTVLLLTWVLNAFKFILASSLVCNLCAC